MCTVLRLVFWQIFNVIGQGHRSRKNTVASVLDTVKHSEGVQPKVDLHSIQRRRWSQAPLPEPQPESLTLPDLHLECLAECINNINTGLLLMTALYRMDISVSKGSLGMLLRGLRYLGIYCTCFDCQKGNWEFRMRYLERITGESRMYLVRWVPSPER